MRSSSYLSDSSIKPNWSIVWSLIPYLLAFRWRVLLALLCLIGAKLVSVATPLILKHVVDSLDGDIAALAVPFGLLIAYGGARFLSALLGELRDTVFARVAERTMSGVAKSVFEHLHRLDLDFHLSRKTGGLSRDIERGTSGTNFLLRFLVFNILPTLIELLLIFFILWAFFDWRYCAVILFSVVLYIGFSIVVTEWRTKFVRDVNELDSRSNTRAIDSLLNYETVKYFDNEQFEVSEYAKALSLWETARIRFRLTLSFLNSGQSFIIALSLTVMMLMAAHDVVNQNLTLGDFVMVNAYMIQLFVPLNFLGFVYREIRQALINIERMFSLLKIEPKVKESPHAVPVEPTNSAGVEVTFSDVHFSYDGKRQVLKGINFVVEAGKTVAIVGASGAGKSTLSKLLFRFYDPTEGAIRINGIPLQDIQLSSLRQLIGVVPQDTMLFNDTIRYNIAYGAPDKSEQNIVDAARRAHLLDFIESLPDGWNTLVGERGLKLSGGEKQRIAIARVLLKNPPILLFDEATSSLDTKSEKLISTALGELAVNHSTIVIAHRLSTVLNADTILVLANGRVVEQGTHTELVELEGVYAGLWLAQSQELQKSE